MTTRVALPAFLILATACSPGDGELPGGPLVYPATATVDQVDVYHGVEVADPYRWLENDVRESEAVRAWVEAQNEVTFAHLNGIPERDAIKRRLTELWDYERFGVPVKEGDRYFYSYNNGLQNQSVVLLQSSLDGAAELLVDPNTWSDDGTVALASFFPSPDGTHLAYLVQDGGTDWRTARVLRIDGRETLADELEWLKFTALSWARDGSGFYYSRYPETDDNGRFQSLNMDQAVYFHRLGTAQAEDALVYSRPDHPDWGFDALVTDDGAYLVITTWKGTDERYQIVYRDLGEPARPPVTLIEGFDHDYSLVGNVGSELYFRTNNAAPRGRLIAIDVANPAPEAWREIVAESENVLDGASLVGGRIIARYMQDARALVRVFETDGRAGATVELPGLGSASGFDGKLDDAETFFSYASFNSPTTIHRYDATTGAVTVFRAPVIDFAGEDYLVEQIFYRSKDGTRVPMFVTRREDVPLDGTAPTLLYGYGGFNIAETPQFSVAVAAWLEMGGIYAVANIRGGGEYGEAWHRAGTKLAKQNVFDDFIAAAEHLIAEAYTSTPRLAIIGGSNGGLLVGAVTNQRPELFGAALPAVGVMDMLRFQEFTAGRFWVDDYGSAEDPGEFRALLAYSPYHNVRSGTRYPPTLISTADTDDRVVPGHSFKYAAAMQAAQAGDAPILIRIETRAGHGAGTPTEKRIEEWADRWAFLVLHLGMRD